MENKIQSQIVCLKTDESKTVSLEELRAAELTDNLVKKKKNKVKLKSVENIDIISTTTKSNVNLKLGSKSTSLASVTSIKSSIFNYSYVVLIASFFSYMLASLLSSCFGVFFESMSTDLGWSHSRVAFIGSLLTALQDLAGPISSALTNHFGCRKTTIFGGLICALGIIGSAYASEFWLLGFLMGGVSGFGASLVLVSSVVVVTYYFEDKPSFAAGFTISGASCGQSIFTMIIIKLNEVYGRSGCFLILGGILLNIIVCGALFRPLKWELEDEEEDNDDEDSDEDEDDDDDEESEDDEDESSKDDETNKKTKAIKKSSTRESNLSEMIKPDEKKASAAPIASAEKILNEEQCLNLYFHDFNDQMNDIFIMENKNENQLFYLENKGALSIAIENEYNDNQMSNSSQYLSHRSRKDFSSDPCLNNKSQNMQMPSIGVSLVSLNSNYMQDNIIEELKQNDFHKNQNYSYFDKHHSLQLIRSESVQSFKKRNLAKSELILKNHSSYSLNTKQKDDNTSEMIEQHLENAEFVLLDAEEMITDCNSNLMLSASQAAIYLPFLENNEEHVDEEEKNNETNLNDENLTNTDNKNNFKMISQRNSSNVLSSIEMKRENSVNISSKTIDNNENNNHNEKNVKSERPLSTFSNFLSKVSNFFSSKKTITTNSNHSSNNSKPNGQLIVNESQAKQNASTIENTAQTTLKNTNMNQLNHNINKKHIITLDPNNYKLIVNPNQSDKIGPRFIIARCNCRQRNLQHMQRRNNKQRRSKIRSYSVNIATEQEALSPLTTTATTTTTDEPKTETTKSQSNIQSPQSKQLRPFDSKNQFKFRHFPNCPISKLNRIKNMHIMNQNHHNLQTNAAGIQNRRNNLYYVPSLFQNSYRFPLHFKNVYYYKSLINLNMRLRNLKNHPATLAGVFNQGGTNHHTNHIHNHHNNNNNNNVSFSCPDLNPKQFFIVNKNVISFKKLNEQYGGNIVPIKAIKRPMQILTTNDLNELNHHQTHSAKHLNLNFTSNLAATSKVLNAGSVLLTTSRDLTTKKKPSFQDKPLIIKFKAPSNNVKEKKLIKIQTSEKKSQDLSLTDFNDKISDTIVSKEKLIAKNEPKTDEEDEEETEEDDDEEEEDDEDDDEDDDDEEEEESCDNCFTRTKAGNYLYKNIWKPMVNSLKFIFYSISENLKLFRLFKFSVFAFCNFILSFFYEAPFVFINSYMMNNKLSESQAGSVTVAVGIVCIFSSIAYGYFGDSKRVNSIILYSVSLVLCGLCCCAIPLFITNYLITMTLMVLLGALISVSDVLVPIICVNLVGYDDFVNAYGLMFFCQGLASLSGPPLLAIIVDYSGDYALSYYIIGVGIILSGVVLSSVLCYNQYTTEKKPEIKKPSTEKA